MADSPEPSDLDQLTSGQIEDELLVAPGIGDELRQRGSRLTDHPPGEILRAGLDEV